MIEFGQFQIDANTRQLLNAGRAVALTPKAFAVLTELIDANGALLTKQALMEKVWKDTIVTDAALTVCIREIRKALGESARSPRFITTLHKRGYCFTGTVNNTRKAIHNTDKTQGNSEAQTLVKRTAEFKKLAHALSRARTGQRQLVFVCGDAGLGKTIFVESFIADNNLHSINFTRGQCIEHYGHAEPYLPWLDAFTKLCRNDNAILNLLKNMHRCGYYICPAC